MATIKVPVTVGKRERLLKAKPTEFELGELVMYINRLYIKETPKDLDDVFSELHESRMEYNCVVKKSAITDMSWFWSTDYEIYVLNVSMGTSTAVEIFMENRDAAIEFHARLIDWWLN